MTSSTPRKTDELLYYNIWVRIASFSDEVSLFRLGGVAKILREIVDQESVWEYRVPSGLAIAQFTAFDTKERMTKIWRQKNPMGITVRQFPAETHPNNHARLRLGSLQWMFSSKIREAAEGVDEMFGRPRGPRAIAGFDDQDEEDDNRWTRGEQGRDHAKNETPQYVEYLAKHGLAEQNLRDRIDEQICELEEVIRTLMENSRKNGSTNNTKTNHNLPSTFFFSNKYFIRYIAATFVAQMATGWTILLEKNLFTKSLLHPDVWWKFTRAELNDTVAVLMCPYMESSNHWQYTDSKQPDKQNYWYCFATNLEKPDQLAAEMVDAFLRVDLRMHADVNVRDVPMNCHLDVGPPLQAANERCKETAQLVSPSGSELPIFYQRPLQALVARCVANAARDRVRQLILLFQLRDAVVPRLVWFGVAGVASGLLYSSCKWLCGGVASMSATEMKQATQLLPALPAATASTIANVSSNASSALMTSDLPEVRYPFLLQQSNQEATAGWFSFLYPSFFKKCASHIYHYYQQFPHPNETPLEERVPNWLRQTLNYGVPIAFVIGEGISIAFWGVGDVTARLGDEYPKQKLVPSFAKRMLMQLPLNVFQFCMNFVTARYGGFFFIWIVSVPLVLGYRMGWRMFWFVTDAIVTFTSSLIFSQNNNNNSVDFTTTTSAAANQIPFSSLNWLSVAGSDLDPENLEIGFYLGHAVLQLLVSTKCFAIGQITVENYLRVLCMEVFCSILQPDIDKQVRRLGWTKNLFNFSSSLPNKEKGGLRRMGDYAAFFAASMFVRYALQEGCRYFAEWKKKRDESRLKKKEV